MKEHPTVGQLKKFLEKFPDDYQVYGYEGEGGSCIVIYRPGNVRERNTDFFDTSGE